MAVRWQFIEDREGDGPFWTWRVLLVDGTIENQSQRFKTYGAAVGDAIRNGFKPSQQHWIVVTQRTATHFRPGEPHVVVPVTAEGAAGRDAVIPPREDEPQPNPASSRRPVEQ